MKVLVADNIAQAGIDILKQTPGIEVQVKTGLSPEELKSCIGGYEGVIVRSATKLTADVLAAAESLRFIVRAGAGVDNIDLAAAGAKGITVMNTPGANSIAAAEHTFALLLALCRNVVPADRSVRKGEWERKRFVGTQLAGKTIGIIGLGRVGKAVAKRAVTFDMKVIGYDPYVRARKLAHAPIEVVNNLEQLLSRADFVTLHVPGTDETRGMIGEKEFALMKPGMRIVNCARGGVISEKALAQALEEGRVAGAALDVFEKEPPADSPLLKFAQVVLTPHLGASTKEAQQTVAIQAAGQLLDALQGKGARNVVSPPESAGSK